MTVSSVKKTKIALEDFFKKTYFNIKQINNSYFNKYNFLKLPNFKYDKKYNLYYIDFPIKQLINYSNFFGELFIFSSIIADRELIYFNYNNSNWLLGIWKGQFGLSTGLIIGLYKKTTNKFIEDYYECLNYKEMKSLNIKFYKNNNVIFDKCIENYYFSGFIPGLFSEPVSLKTDISLTFKNKKFTEAIAESLTKLGYKKFIQNSYKINFTLSKPFTKQSHSRNVTLEKEIQKNNKCYCKKYIKLSKSLNIALNEKKNISLIFSKSNNLKQCFLKFVENDNYNLKKLSTFLKNY